MNTENKWYDKPYEDTKFARIISKIGEQVFYWSGFLSYFFIMMSVKFYVWLFRKLSKKSRGKSIWQ